MADTAVVGIGNPYRGDDGAGWMVIDKIGFKIGNRVELCKVRGEMTELLDVFSRFESVFLVDACLNKGAIGQWRRINLLAESLESESPQTSTHGFNLTQAVAMARNLELMPNTLILYALSSDRFAIQEGLSAAMLEGVNQVADALLNELEV